MVKLPSNRLLKEGLSNEESEQFPEITRQLKMVEE